jgi:hypothetical protein
LQGGLCHGRGKLAARQYEATFRDNAVDETVLPEVVVLRFGGLNGALSPH